MTADSVLTSRGVPRVDSDSLESRRWNADLNDAGGHLLQTWAWGELKQRHGWMAERVSVGDGDRRALAQVLVRRKGPVSVAYIPRGPACDGADQETIGELFAAIDIVCRRHRALYVVVEPNGQFPVVSHELANRYVSGGAPFQPVRTVKIPLLDDDGLLGQMHPKTRYSVRLAERRGVMLERPVVTDEAVLAFHGLLEDTSRRNDFGIHPPEYYGDFLRLFGDNALLLFARNEGQLAAALIAGRFGAEAIYMYGASSTEHRAHGASYSLQFEAMRWARSAGCLQYDLWGIPAEDPTSTSDSSGHVAGTSGSDWRGLYKFKTGFGGEIVAYPRTYERRYHPVLSFIARRFYADRA